MTLEWAQNKEAEMMKKVMEEQQKIIDFVSSLSFLTDEEKEIINNRTRELVDPEKAGLGYFMPYFYTIRDIEDKYKPEFRDDLWMLNNILDNGDSPIRLRFKDELNEELKEKGVFGNEYISLLKKGHPKYYYNYVDIGPYEFDGDIIITDPCYVLNSEELRHSYREDLIEAGFKEAMVNSTLYGDWGCTTFDTNTKEVLGEFCADGGEVGVFYLEDIKRLDPEGYNWLLNEGGIERGCATLIKNFKGTVTFVISEEHYKFEGKDRTSYELKVVGKGIDKATGKPLEFIGTQTSL